MKKVILIATSVVMLAALAGCETIKGMGRDIENVGNGLQSGANKTQQQTVRS